MYCYDQWNGTKVKIWIAELQSKIWIAELQLMKEPPNSGIAYSYTLEDEQ
jgi:hypothetical protein